MISDNSTIENQLFIDFRDNGNRQSFEELFRIVKPWLFKIIYRIVADYDDAKDVMQNAWIKLINNGDRFDTDKGNINNLIFTIATNEALVWKRRDRLVQKSNDILKSVPDSKVNHNNPETLHLNCERSEAIKEAIGKLNKNYQDVIILYYYSELSVKEIAGQLSVPEGTVKTWLDRGRDKLSKYLKNYISNS